ncbi:hypothetical protein LMG28727_00411 [Paraburkholderia kirstenboschensis]|uniref:DUF6600 domain-containing protein n=2 Tax=Paraburkholderia kirstenboschensis TaxID=1245436 RepID=UPI00191931F9|nr:DUF6600 domain-containing protein [Paraburkholderia kirstenboschensis]CAD6511039.1 hypothetical protein LMG28727_00411 [Paraburkholderia kirstenboschensis]
MRTTTSPPPSFRRTVGYSLIAAAAFVFAAQAALAQQAAPAPQDIATENSDPPGRVARLNYMAGTVTTEPAGAADWSYAQINRPLTTGDQLWNDQNARSELHIGSTAVRLGQSTSLDLLGLDDNNAQLKVAQGTLSAHVRELPPGSSYEIDTPNLALGLNGPGDYRVDVAPDGSSTTVTVRNGTATAYGDGAQVPIAAGQQIRFAGTSLQTLADESAPGPDGFDQWTASRDAAENRSVSARYVSREIPGYQDLDANGTWRSSPQYGEVWVPRATPVGWAPYRDGHWVWQAPWGWTWVDDAPWGFAPYHYGRWAYVDDSWAWVPGPVVVSAPPVYAPALVAFVGGGGGGADWGVNLAIGGAVAAGVAWFPLGPGERWHPHWGDRDHWSPRYYERVNQTTVINNYNRNITNVHNTYVNYRAPRAVTAVPATAFVHGQPVGRFAQKVDPAQWRNARINPGAPGIAPVRESYGPGQRNANYRPPAGVMTRPVVATRSPSMPPAYRDGLAQRFAQSGGRVPGAGQPIVRTSVPARMAGGPGALPVQNVRVVQSHLPGRMPGAAAGAPILQTGPGGQAAPGAAGAAQNGGRQAGHPPGDVPVAGQPGRAGAQPERPGMPSRWNGQQTGAAGAPPNGVPRPPQANGGNLGLAPQRGMAQQPAQQPAHQQGQPVAADGRHEPSWTQPHTPMAQQAQQGRQRGGEEPQAPRPGWAQQPGGQPNTAMQPREVPRPVENPAIGQQPRAVQDQRQHAQGAETIERPLVQQQPRQDVHAQVAQSGPAPRQQPQAPRQEFQPQQAQQRSEPRPQPQALQAPRQEFHPQQAQQRPEPRPQPQAQQAPRQEFHPQQAQPRPEPQVQQPRPQPQQHGEQRSAGGHDEHHKG